MTDLMKCSLLCIVTGSFALIASSLYGGESLSLSEYERTLIYETGFENPGEHTIVHESKDLFQNGERQPLPDDADWVYEGRNDAWIEDGKLWLGGDRTHDEFGREANYHSVLWNTRTFPGSFLLEFQVTQTQKKGLNIVFFAARAREKYGGGSIFKPELPKRGARFGNYIKGAIDCYHISYFATSRRGSPRGHANMRKNHGFHKVAQGEDFISKVDDKGPHTVRLLKVDNKVTIEVNGKIALEWKDTGEVGGPPHGAGQIGLRQMRRSAICAYDNVKVWKLSGK